MEELNLEQIVRPVKTGGKGRHSGYKSTTKNSSQRRNKQADPTNGGIRRWDSNKENCERGGNNDPGLSRKLFSSKEKTNTLETLGCEGIGGDDVSEIKYSVGMNSMSRSEQEELSRDSSNSRLVELLERATEVCKANPTRMVD